MINVSSRGGAGVDTSPIPHAAVRHGESRAPPSERPKSENFMFAESTSPFSWALPGKLRGPRSR